MSRKIYILRKGINLIRKHSKDNSCVGCYLSKFNNPSKNLPGCQKYVGEDKKLLSCSANLTDFIYVRVN